MTPSEKTNQDLMTYLLSGVAATIVALILCLGFVAIRDSGADDAGVPKQASAKKAPASTPAVTPTVDAQAAAPDAPPPDGSPAPEANVDPAAPLPDLNLAAV